jgi:endonuclease YncB( thermonuclease family)
MINATRGLVVALAVLTACAAEPPQAQPTVVDGRVVGVADGDTIRVLDAQKHEFRIRLEGIDSPEKGQPFGDAARDATSRLAFGKQVRVHVSGLDDYGRSLGRVEIDGLELNRTLVTEGMAWRYKYSRDAALGAAETKARAERRGLWRDAHPVSPWEWRQAHPRPRS